MKEDIEKLEKMIDELKEQDKVKREARRMKTGKKALYSAYVICISLLAFTMIMIALGKDTTSLTILAGAGVGILPIMYGIYDHYNTKINLKHMEENYIPNYDEEEGIY